jgi:hypothetical protein
MNVILNTFQESTRSHPLQTEGVKSINSFGRFFLEKRATLGDPACTGPPRHMFLRVQLVSQKLLEP